MDQQQNKEKAKEPMGAIERLFTENATARILYYFISHRFHTFSLDEVAKALGLSNEIVSAAIKQLEKREIITQDKKIENENTTVYTLYVESMTTNAIIRAAFEIANVEEISSERQNREQKSKL